MEKNELWKQLRGEVEVGKAWLRHMSLLQSPKQGGTRIETVAQTNSRVHLIHLFGRYESIYSPHEILFSIPNSRLLPK